MRVHIERVNREVVRCEVKGLEDLLQRELLSITEDNDVLSEAKGAMSPASIEYHFARTSGLCFILNLMKRRRCFWFMLLEW